MENSEIEIRSAVESDAVRIAELCLQLGYNASPADVGRGIRQLADSRESALFVAEEGGLVEGWIQVAQRSAIESGTFAEIIGLVVDEAVRGRGVGAALVAEAEWWARAAGVSSLRVRTNVLRVKTHSFYARMGFEETKKQIVFQKDLGSPG